MPFEVIFKPSIEKDLKFIPKQQIHLILNKIELLKTNSFPYNSLKLSGTRALYRIRIGDYRSIYSVDHNLMRIIIHYIQHRRDVYRSI
ncbi:MAG: type II toxin-antitoxin system RelE family toxin [Elusimicrobiota bacterium]